MAELMMREMIPEQSIAIDSAGIRGLPDHPIDDTVAALLHRDGVSTEGFRSKKVDAALVKNADLILCFERSQRSMIVSAYPMSLKRTFLLEDYANMADYCHRNSMLDDKPTRMDKLREITANAPMARPSLPVSGEIHDPHGRDPETYELVHNRIARALDLIAQATSA
jgi:protein-tyrosine phosphatase